MTRDEYTRSTTVATIADALTAAGYKVQEFPRQGYMRGRTNGLAGPSFTAFFTRGGALIEAHYITDDGRITARVRSGASRCTRALELITKYPAPTA